MLSDTYILKFWKLFIKGLKKRHLKYDGEENAFL